MITKILVGLDIIDNGYLDPKSVPSTCAVAQALGKPLFAQHFPSAQVLNRYVLLRGRDDSHDTVFTVSLAFRDWIYTFDRWQKLRAQLEHSKMEGRIPSELRGRPPRPITILVDTDNHHISIDGESESESRKAELPPHLHAQYLKGLHQYSQPTKKTPPRHTKGGWASSTATAKQLSKDIHPDVNAKTAKSELLDLSGNWK